MKKKPASVSPDYHQLPVVLPDPLALPPSRSNSGHAALTAGFTAVTMAFAIRGREWGAVPQAGPPQRDFVEGISGPAFADRAPVSGKRLARIFETALVLRCDVRLVNDRLIRGDVLICPSKCDQGEPD